MNANQFFYMLYLQIFVFKNNSDPKVHQNIVLMHFLFAARSSRLLIHNSECIHVQAAW